MTENPENPEIHLRRLDLARRFYEDIPSTAQGVGLTQYDVIQAMAASCFTWLEENRGPGAGWIWLEDFVAAMKTFMIKKDNAND